MINIGAVGPAGLENEHLLQKIGWQMVNLPMEVRNAFVNHVVLECGNNPTRIPAYQRLLQNLFENPGRVQSMEMCPKERGPAVIVGSGSSLDAFAPNLKDWKGGVICSTSQASTLIYHGRYPDYIICMDPRVAVVDLELDVPDFGPSAMLAHPSIPFQYIDKWITRAKGPLYLARIMEPSYDWYTHHLPQGYPWVNHVILPMIDSVAAEIGFATWLGYSPLYLIGVDYAGPRFQRWDYNYETKAWTPDRVMSGYEAPNAGNFSGMTASGAMAYSSRGALLSAYMQMKNDKYNQRIYQLSPVSALNQFPLVKWEDVESPPEWNLEAVIEPMEIMLAAWDTFLVPSPGPWGINYHTYIAKDEGLYAQSMAQYNKQVEANKANFEQLEKQHKRPLLDMIRDGWITIEAGDFLTRGADEFGSEFDWHKLGTIDIGAVLSRRKYLLDRAKELGISRPEGAMTKATKERVAALRIEADGAKAIGRQDAEQIERVVASLEDDAHFGPKRESIKVGSGSDINAPPLGGLPEGEVVMDAAHPKNYADMQRELDARVEYDYAQAHIVELQTLALKAKTVEERTKLLADCDRYNIEIARKFSDMQKKKQI
jgi:hypothetical protein